MGGLTHDVEVGLLRKTRRVPASVAAPVVVVAVVAGAHDVDVRAADSDVPDLEPRGRSGSVKTAREAVLNGGWARGLHRRSAGL